MNVKSIEDHLLTALPVIISSTKKLLEKNSAVCNTIHDRVLARDMNIDHLEDWLSALVLTSCLLSYAWLRNSMSAKIFLSCCYPWNDNNRTNKEILDVCSTVKSFSGPLGSRNDWQGKKERKQKAVLFILRFLLSRGLKGVNLRPVLEKNIQRVVWLAHAYEYASCKVYAAVLV